MAYEGIGLETVFEGLQLLNLRVCAWLPVFGGCARAWRPFMLVCERGCGWRFLGRLNRCLERRSMAVLRFVVYRDKPQVS